MQLAVRLRPRAEQPTALVEPIQERQELFVECPDAAQGDRFAQQQRICASVEGEPIPRPDYNHYRERQLAPAADGLLHFLDTSFAQITDQQLEMF